MTSIMFLVYPVFVWYLPFIHYVSTYICTILTIVSLKLTESNMEGQMHRAHYCEEKTHHI